MKHFVSKIQMDLAQTEHSIPCSQLTRGFQLFSLVILMLLIGIPLPHGSLKITLLAQKQKRKRQAPRLPFGKLFSITTLII